MYWVMFPPPHCTVSRKECLALSILDRVVISEIMFAFLGSILVYYFAADILLHFSVALWISSGDWTYVPVYQSSFLFQ